ncbi:MAG: hypothetical protein EOQ28_09160 [Mesorhizobium sp.]|nr:MAG: hypothetical protein EOQ28_09160 [Mesorhizobium sp.]
MAVAGERSRRSRFPVRHASSSRRGGWPVARGGRNELARCRYSVPMVSLVRKADAVTAVRTRRCR